MARIEIEMINNFVFETELEVRMTEINLANHVGLSIGKRGRKRPDNC